MVTNLPAIAKRLTDGAPDVTRLPCDRLVAADGAEYMRRYYLQYGESRQARFHHIMASDPQRDFHDHPWDFVSHLLTGVYVEHTPNGAVRYEAPCIIIRKAEQLHRLELPEGDVWSYVILGKWRRHWGFATEHGWVKWDQYGAGSVAGCAPENPRRRSYHKPRKRIPEW